MVPWSTRPAGRLDPYAETGLPMAICEFAEVQDLKLDRFASAEAQVAALSDDIAYNAHDIDDGLRAGLFDVIDLGDVPLVGTALADVVKKHRDLERPRLIHETVRRLISGMVEDVLAETTRRLDLHGPASADEVRNLDVAIAALSESMFAANAALKRFLSDRMYHHERVLDVMDRAKRVVRDLFEALGNDPSLLPPEWQPDDDDNESGRARKVCDFIAGMTDRYALQQHKRLFDVDPLFR